MTTKICSKCNQDLHISNFSYKHKSRGVLSNHCRACHSSYNKRHYEQNKAKYIERSKRWKRERRLEFFTWLQKQNCVDCGNADYRVLEFDHLEKKNFDISQKIPQLRLSSLMSEIEKCDIVCANCHRIRTAVREGYYQYLSDTNN